MLSSLCWPNIDTGVCDKYSTLARITSHYSVVQYPLMSFVIRDRQKGGHPCLSCNSNFLVVTKNQARLYRERNRQKQRNTSLFSVGRACAILVVDFPRGTRAKVDREFAAKNACDDWAKDNDGCGTMTHDRFVDSLFELVGRSLLRLTLCRK